jgi:hypothetical protein
MTTPIPAIMEIYLCDPLGVRISCLDYATEIEYVKTCNDRTPFRIKLPSLFDRNLIRLDGILEIWRGFEPGTLSLDYCGFVRTWRFSDDSGSEYTELSGYSLLDLLRRRVVAYAAASAQAAMFNQADDMIKAIVKDNLGADAIAARDIDTYNGFSIQADLADGQEITKAFSYKNVLEICQEIAAASTQYGTQVFFDIVPVITNTTTGGLTFRLETYSEQRGADRTADSDSPVYVGTAWHNLENGYLEYDFSDEINYAYVLGQGEEAARETYEVSDTTRIGESIYNRCEGAVDARNVEAGDTGGLIGEGSTYLDENKPTLKFGGDIVETPDFRYGLHWFQGDRVTAEYGGIQIDAMIKTVAISKNSNGQEKISAWLEVEGNVPHLEK